MPRSRRVLETLGALCLLAVVQLAQPGIAAADEGAQRPLEISIDEGEGQTVVHVRDPGGELSEPKIATSHRGFMLSFEDEVVVKDARRTNAWRLGRVQTGQYGNRAVVRLIQRKGRRGPIDDHAQVVAVDDGLDIVVVDRLAPPAPLTPDAGLGQPADAAAPATGDAAAAVPTTAETVAALQNELGPMPNAPETALATDDTPATDQDVAPVEGNAAEPASPDAEAEALASAERTDPTGAEGFDLDEAPADPAAAGPFVSGDGEATTPASFAAWTLIPSILGLAGLGLWMRRRKQTLAGTALEVVAKTSLGPKQQIVQVKVDGRELLLGVTEHQIGLITEVGGSVTSTPAMTASPAERSSRTTAASANSTHHEFGVPAPVMDRTDAAASSRIDAFKSRLSSALRSEVANNDSGEDVAPSPAAAPRPADLGELRRLLDRRGEDPAWAREDVA